MSYILLGVGDTLLAMQEGSIGFAGHSDRSRFRTKELAELEKIVYSESEELAREVFQLMRIERIRCIEDAIAADGRSAFVDGPVPRSNGIGHWFTQRGKIYRRTGSGTIYLDEQAVMTPAQAVDAFWSAPMLWRVQVSRQDWPTAVAWSTGSALPTA